MLSLRMTSDERVEVKIKYLEGEGGRSATISAPSSSPSNPHCVSSSMFPFLFHYIFFSLFCLLLFVLLFIFLLTQYFLLNILSNFALFRIFFSHHHSLTTHEQTLQSVRSGAVPDGGTVGTARDGLAPLSSADVLCCHFYLRLLGS